MIELTFDYLFFDKILTHTMDKNIIDKYHYIRDTCELIGATREVIAPGVRLYEYSFVRGYKIGMIIVAIDEMRYILFSTGIDIIEFIDDEQSTTSIRFDVDCDSICLTKQAMDVTNLIYSLIPILLRYSQLKIGRHPPR